MAQVFISHAWKNKAKVLPLVEFLQSHGITCWVDTERLAPGGDLVAGIAQGVSSCTVLLALLTPEYLESEICVREFQLAVAYKKAVIPLKAAAVPWPVKVSDGTHADALALHLNPMTYTALPPALPDAAFYAELLAALQARGIGLAGSPSAEAPAPEGSPVWAGVKLRKGAAVSRGGSSGGGSGNSRHSFDPVEVFQHVHALNSLLASEPCFSPLDPVGNHLFEQMGDGTFLLRLLRKVEPASVPDEAFSKHCNRDKVQGAEEFQNNETVRQFLALATAAGLSAAKNMGASNLTKGKDGVLPALWQLIRRSLENELRAVFARQEAAALASGLPVPERAAAELDKVREDPEGYLMGWMRDMVRGKAAAAAAAAAAAEPVLGGGGGGSAATPAAASQPAGPPMDFTLEDVLRLLRALDPSGLPPAGAAPPPYSPEARATAAATLLAWARERGIPASATTEALAATFNRVLLITLVVQVFTWYTVPSAYAGSSSSSSGSGGSPTPQQAALAQAVARDPGAHLHAWVEAVLQRGGYAAAAASVAPSPQALAAMPLDTLLRLMHSLDPSCRPTLPGALEGYATAEAKAGAAVAWLQLHSIVTGCSAAQLAGPGYPGLVVSLCLHIFTWYYRSQPGPGYVLRKHVQGEAAGAAARVQSHGLSMDLFKDKNHAVRTALGLNMTTLATDRTVCELEDMLAAHRLASPQADNASSALLAPLAAVVRALRLQDPAPTAGQAWAAVEGFVHSLPTEQGAEAVLERLLAVAKGAVGVCAGGAVVYYQLDVITVNWVVPPPGVTG